MSDHLPTFQELSAGTLDELQRRAVEPHAVILTVRLEARDGSVLRNETATCATPAMIVDVMAALSAHRRPN